MFEPERDERYHERGCSHFDIRSPVAESTHVDHFCDCHHFTEPKILRSGSDIRMAGRLYGTRGARMAPRA